VVLHYPHTRTAEPANHRAAHGLPKTGGADPGQLPYHGAERRIQLAGQLVAAQYPVGLGELFGRQRMGADNDGFDDTLRLLRSRWLRDCDFGAEQGGDTGYLFHYGSWAGPGVL